MLPGNGSGDGLTGRRIEMQQIHYTVDQIVDILVQHEARTGLAGLREFDHGAAAALSDADRIQMLLAENQRLRMLLIEALLDKATFEDILRSTQCSRS
jgi:hypothetical protein